MPNQASPTASESGSLTTLVRGDNSWHFDTRKLLYTEKRPSTAERREVIRIVVAEIVVVYKKPGKRHITKIAQKTVICSPKSFQDEIEGQDDGTGHDSLVEQFRSRADSYKGL